MDPCWLFCPTDLTVIIFIDPFKGESAFLKVNQISLVISTIHFQISLVISVIHFPSYSSILFSKLLL